jgi:hypothetical protein
MDAHWIFFLKLEKDRLPLKVYQFLNFKMDRLLVKINLL